jgi:two-component system response regulator
MNRNKWNRKPYILLAEDDRDDRFLLEEAFSEVERSLQLQFVEGGNELLNQMNDRLQQAGPLPSVIMLDLNLPKMDGKTTLQILKGHAVYKYIPVVILSTSGDKRDIQHCYACGANTYIVKPASFKTLTFVIGTLCTYWLDIASGVH